VLIAIGTILVIWAIWLAIYDRSNFFLPYMLALGSVFMLIGFLLYPAASRDLGQWKNADPEISAWYRALKQNDSPTISCCGEADSYWCDEGARGSQVTCTINDDRDDAALMRKHVPNGTVIEIPQHKINKDPNPTGHAVVFLSVAGFVWCFVGINGS